MGDKLLHRSLKHPGYREALATFNVSFGCYTVLMAMFDPLRAYVAENMGLNLPLNRTEMGLRTRYHNFLLVWTSSCFPQ